MKLPPWKPAGSSLLAPEQVLADVTIKPGKRRRPSRAVEPLLLSMREAARLLCIDRNATLKELIDEGILTVVSVKGRPRIRRQDVDQLALDGVPEGRGGRRKRRARAQKPDGKASARIRALKIR